MWLFNLLVYIIEQTTAAVIGIRSSVLWNTRRTGGIVRGSTRFISML